jgi:uridine kinase
MVSSATNLIQPKSANLNIGVKNRDFEILKIVENDIFNFLKEDKELEQPVILSISSKAIIKLTYFLGGLSERPVAIGVAGETASGKSSFVCDIVDSINSIHAGMGIEENITKVNADNYYYDRSKEVLEAGGIAKFVENYDLDAPSAVDLDLLKIHIEKLICGHDALTPTYNMDGTAVRIDNHILCKSNPIIISEGIFNLNDKIKDVFDFCLYVNVSPEAQRERWFRRAAERDFKGAQAEKAFSSIMDKTKIHIKPTVSNADIIINGEANREDYRKSAEKLFNIFMDIANVPV